ncbi:SNF2_N-domain-containing protein [Fragilariopsis cylindrus CCMP1102]|uniref:SNF2_N-domain-containing protein n=1 Tax=Fragilariopsis cylindrus CCMP1102 TaxID=635003 RepID=A0A1E7FSL9_9STRA|nr:SNF2_N-domain-containing protein [Fragilariopsis cylindrus CCMP1102]|eukprot:OEU20833.1 SNF2_N-domain-containing protein [Fragilariopsis cylindrus CCMP1102]
MWELHRQQAGGILGDEMGLGKTIQVASFLGSMAASRKLKAILIISPATLLQHWLKEMKRWAPGVRRFLIHQSGDTLSTTRQLDPSTFCGTAYVFVTTFENVRRNEDIYMNHRWSYVVIDEAQKIRNPNAYITLACKKFKTPHRLALSGTPIQNDLRELWSIFDFVFPGRLGTLPAFETEFATPIKKGGYSNASPMQVQLSYRCALILKDLINPYLLRRLKKDIKEVQRMPGKKEQVLFCRLSDCQRSMYEAFLQSDLVKKVFRGSVQLLGAITTLRKICNHPDLVSPPDEFASDPFSESILDNYGSDDDDTSQKIGDGTVDRYHELIERSGKLEILAKILPLWKKQGHRVLIFCQWRKMLDIIMDFVKSKGWKFGRLDGNTNVASRQRLVDTFNSDESYFGMLCTTRTGGVGLNLVGADRVILYDPDWNPQTDAQARERAWRFGQEREVTVYRMICAGTVEEKIYQRQIFKTALSNSVLQDSKQRRLFTHKDLKDLFSLKADNGSVATGAEGITETAELTKGDGYVDPDDNEITANAKEQDNGETMQSVLKSRGLAGIFDHDVVEGNWKSKRASVREMEAKAKKLSREALQNLRQSVAPVNDLGSRFGSSGARSNSILSSIAERNTEILNAGTLSSADEIKQNTQLLKDLRNFVKTRVPTTNELLDTFSSHVTSSDAAVFRRLLKSIATLKNGSWILK